jgi:hypothetical protein
MINMAVGYLLVSLVFLIRSVLSMEEDVAVIESTRSREQRATSKKMADKKKQELVLCLAWPYQIVKALRSVFLYYKGA